MSDYKNSAGVKFNGATDLIIRADPDGTVESCFNRSNDTEYVITPEPPAITHVGYLSLTLNYTSTTATDVGTIDLGADCYTGHKLLYISVRDSAGMKDGYFYGTDSFLANNQAALGKTGQIGTMARLTCYYAENATNKIGVTASGGGATLGYGIYGGNISPEGVLHIYAKYDSSYSRTINGTYDINAYLIEWPDKNLMGEDIIR